MSVRVAYLLCTRRLLQWCYSVSYGASGAVLKCPLCVFFSEVKYYDVCYGVSGEALRRLLLCLWCSITVSDTLFLMQYYIRCHPWPLSRHSQHAQFRFGDIPIGVDLCVGAADQR